MQLELCTNDYIDYSNYFSEFSDDRDTSVNFTAIVFTLMERYTSAVCYSPKSVDVPRETRRKLYGVRILFFTSRP